ncbi:type II toxin-antitoxin system YafQ family toxin [uncultured Phascolarctobacterium sp.]|uniref:type II toxin-antitoxin system YafQ family toxin n=1 Tax=uncultured Phascolarctobacterium sp. TaxID=512296 RepID=UPI0026285FB2|nr:type II toxin-antitoxin system YafQ family toxin [uncultured Phascolarctobacterium sp.]
MKYQLSISNRFKKDLKFLKKRGYNLTYLQEVIDILLEGKELVWITAMISMNLAVIFLLLN